MIFHSGSISVDGKVFNGNGYFKFAITNGHSACTAGGADCVTYWSNDNSSANGSEPNNAIALEIINGGYSIHLGDISRINQDTTIHMDSIPADVFLNESTYLHIWFSDNGKDRWQQLLPARRLVSVPYAYTALNALGVGQSWQDVMAERTPGTVYSNDTGRPIMVNICTQRTPDNQQINLYVYDADNNEVRVGYSYDSNSPGDGNSMGTIVPSGHSYKVEVTSGSVTCWAELR